MGIEELYMGYIVVHKSICTVSAYICVPSLHSRSHGRVFACLAPPEACLVLGWVAEMLKAGFGGGDALIKQGGSTLGP